PETADYGDLHYLMTPHQALSLALLNEQRARDYYLGIAGRSSDPEVKALAGELAEEEREHVSWVEQWMERFPPAEPDWDHDDDPPILQD
ncbi:MAG: ferritin family protein, partial [Xanthomonadales bacterium]|nr:ferritin family protein [Xanthomonadales bacterium]